MSDERPRTITVTETVEWEWVGNWVGDGAPQACKCGHLHYPRVPVPNHRNLFPQWDFCEDETCTRHSLERTDR